MGRTDECAGIVRRFGVAAPQALRNKWLHSLNRDWSKQVELKMQRPRPALSDLSMKQWVGAAIGVALWIAPAQGFAADAVKYKSSWEHYLALKAQAKGGDRMTWDKLPDWTGVWAREGGFANMAFDPKQPKGGPATAVLTPEYQAKYAKKLADLEKGIQRDPVTECLPAGYPRFLTEPYSREFVVRPEYVVWIQEEGNEVRRIYLDGRDHLPDDEANPEPEGDSIGFWWGQSLVVHTNHLREGQYSYNQPDYSDQVSTVEIIRLVDKDTIEDDVTVYDPPALAEPWHVVSRYQRITDVPNIRLNYWPCVEASRAVMNTDGTVGVRMQSEADKK